MLAWVLIAATALAADIEWDLSQRWRYTSELALFEVDDLGEPSSGRVGTEGYTYDFDPAWFQRTRFSANIADKHMVRVFLGTDASFKNLRQLAASYLGSGWMIDYERGTFEHRFEDRTVATTETTGSEAGSSDPRLLPTDPHPVRSFDAVTVAADLGGREEPMYVYVGATWTHLVRPARLLYWQNQVTIEGIPERELGVLDDRTQIEVLTATFRADMTRSLVLSRGCPAAFCVRPGWESDIGLGASIARPSKDGQERYKGMKEDHWPEDEVPDAVTLGPGLVVNLAMSAGILGIVPIGDGLIALEAGASLREFGIFGLGGERVRYASVGQDHTEVAMSLYYGPHIEVYTQF